MGLTRCLWLLPDRTQSGRVMAVESDEVVPVEQAIDILQLPPALVLGVPESVLREHSEPGYLFGQLARLKDGRFIYCVSGRAGTDVGGRTVCMTSVQFLDGDVNPVIPEPPGPSCVSSDDWKFAEAICLALRQPETPGVREIRAMMDVARTGRFSTLASIDVPRNANQHEWTPGKKNF